MLATVLTWTPSPAQAEETERKLVFGSFAERRAGQSLQQAVLQLESQIGRKLEVVRVFQWWDDPFPDSFHTFLRDGNRTPILSVRPQRRNGSLITWADLAAAAPGSQVDQELRMWARRVRDFGAPAYVTLHHEPETVDNMKFGIDTDFKAAWRHWVDVFREEGVTNARYMWIMTDWGHEVPATDRRHAAKWYPGDAWVDDLAIDAYNWHRCRVNMDIPWKSLEQVIEPFRKFGLQHPTKDLWLAEFGSWEDPSTEGRKGAWFDDARALFATPAYSQFEGVVYFNWNTSSGFQANCNWRVDTSASSLAAFAAMANDPLYSGSAFTTAPPPPPPPPPPSNEAPKASFTFDCVDLRCDFASTSSDADGTIASLSWDFGGPGTVEGSKPSYSFARAGTYPVTLTVTDDGGATDRATRDVTVSEGAPAEPITFVAATASNVNATSHRLTVPASVRADDGLVLAFTANTSATVTGPAGWRLLGVESNGVMSTRLWSRVAAGSTAGTTVTVGTSSISKGNLVLSAYRGTSTTDPVSSVASALESTSRAGHAAPEVSVAGDRAWVVTYWAHRDSASTTLTPPAGVTVRSNTSQGGGGRITGLLADSNGPTGPGSYSAGTATGAAATPNATMWSVVLAPR